MTVADLIQLLRQHDQRATVMLWDQTAAGEPELSMLGTGEVQPLLLGARESIGLLALEAWNADDQQLEGPFNGVALGSAF